MSALSKLSMGVEEVLESRTAGKFRWTERADSGHVSNARIASAESTGTKVDDSPAQRPVWIVTILPAPWGVIAWGLSGVGRGIPTKDIIHRRLEDTMTTRTHWCPPIRQPTKKSATNSAIQRSEIRTAHPSHRSSSPTHRRLRRILAPPPGRVTSSHRKPISTTLCKYLGFWASVGFLSVRWRGPNLHCWTLFFVFMGLVRGGVGPQPGSRCNSATAVQGSPGRVPP